MTALRFPSRAALAGTRTKCHGGHRWGKGGGGTAPPAKGQATYQVLLSRLLHIVGKGIGVLQGVAALGEEAGRLMQILPVDPRPLVSTHFVLYFRLDALPELFLHLQ